MCAYTAIHNSSFTFLIKFLESEIIFNSINSIPLIKFEYLSKVLGTGI